MPICVRKSRNLKLFSYKFKGLNKTHFTNTWFVCTHLIALFRADTKCSNENLEVRNFLAKNDLTSAFNTHVDRSLCQTLVLETTGVSDEGVRVAEGERRVQRVFTSGQRFCEAAQNFWR